MEAEIQEKSEEQRLKEREQIKQVERELLDKNRLWSQEKANWVAKRVLCLIN
ncbi:MAG: hypothetical protein WC781_04635 [Candidatus Pacearchaeota archaeon]|jgi:hypothetical protein